MPLVIGKVYRFRNVMLRQSQMGQLEGKMGGQDANERKAHFVPYATDGEYVDAVVQALLEYVSACTCWARELTPKSSDTVGRNSTSRRQP